MLISLLFGLTIKSFLIYSNLILWLFGIKLGEILSRDRLFLERICYLEIIFNVKELGEEKQYIFTLRKMNYLCPYWRLNLQPFGVQDDVLTNCTHPARVDLKSFWVWNCKVISCAIEWCSANWVSSKMSSTINSYYKRTPGQWEIPATGLLSSMQCCYTELC